MVVFSSSGYLRMDPEGNQGVRKPVPMKEP